MKFRLIIDKAKDEETIVIAHKKSQLTDRIEELVSGYSDDEFIIGYNDDKMRKLVFEEIECITIIDRKVIAVDTKGFHYRIKDNLRDLENTLPPYFIRINKSSIANEHRIERFDAVFSGSVDAVFKCGYREYVSRRCFTKIRRRYEK